MSRSPIHVLVMMSALAVCGPVLAGEPPAFSGQGAICKGGEGYQASFEGRRTFRLRPEWLKSAKSRLADPEVATAYKGLLARADAALAGPTYTVVDKSRTPPSGDKHDYISMGPYWWPDPSKPNGEPYQRRDGQINPERNTNAFDVTDLEAMSASFEALALAYYFSDDPRYAAKAAQLLRVWFLDPATRMNPNATFAQGVPGVTPGRAEGVLDTARMLRITETIGLLTPSGAWTAGEQKILERWFSDYLIWMQTSPTGRGEEAKTNNHGGWFDAQAAGFALFTRQDDIARKIVARAADKRIAVQIQPDGSMPEELERTRALNYSYYALEAMVETADFGRCVGLDLWRYKTADGRGMRASFDFLGAYVGREASFPHKDYRPEEAASKAMELYTRAAWAFGDGALADKAAIVSPKYPEHRSRLVLVPYRH